MTGNVLQHCVSCDRVPWDGGYLSLCLFTVWQDAAYEERGPEFAKEKFDGGNGRVDFVNYLYLKIKLFLT